jgi:hypothetical protein
VSFNDRLPPVPSNIKDKVVEDYLRRIVRQLNREQYVSRFSAATPETAGSFLTGRPGDLAVNIGSASTNTRVWVKTGVAGSFNTTGWTPLRTV